MGRRHREEVEEYRRREGAPTYYEAARPDIVNRRNAEAQHAARVDDFLKTQRIVEQGVRAASVLHGRLPRPPTLGRIPPAALDRRWDPPPKVVDGRPTGDS